jgi:hypothetical protein
VPELLGFTATFSKLFESGISGGLFSIDSNLGVVSHGHSTTKECDEAADDCLNLRYALDCNFNSSGSTSHGVEVIKNHIFRVRCRCRFPLGLCSGLHGRH